MICCDEYINLGCYTHCDCIYLMDIFADMDGTWQILYSYSGSDAVHLLELTDLVAGDAIAMGNRFNVNNRIFLRIRRPDYSYYSIDEIECFKLSNSLQIYEGALARNQLCLTEAPKEQCNCPVIIAYTPLESASRDCDYEQQGCFAIQVMVDHVCGDDVSVDFFIDSRKFIVPKAGTIFVDKLYNQLYDYKIDIRSEYCLTTTIESTLDLTAVTFPSSGYPYP